MTGDRELSPLERLDLVITATKALLRQAERGGPLLASTAAGIRRTLDAMAQERAELLAAASIAGVAS